MEGSAECKSGRRVAGHKARLRLAAAFLGGVCSALVAADQTWVPEPTTTLAQLRPGPGEISVDQAAEAARAFFRKIGVDVPAELPTASRLKIGGKPVSNITLSYSGDGFVLVDVHTGQACCYYNGRRAADRANRKVPQGPLRLSNALSAQTYAFTLMETIGLPKGCKLVELKCLHYPDDPGGPGDYPEVEARFQPVPFGYRIDDSFGMYDLDLDPFDGTITDYAAPIVERGAYTIESHIAAIKAAEAVEKAKAIALKYKVGRRPSDDPSVRPEPTKPAEPMFVSPNGSYGGPPAYDRTKSPARLRLAWVFFYPRDEQIWIDAADGKVLGGYCHSQQQFMR